MKRSIWIAAILVGMVSHEASAYEVGAGIGRQYGCLAPGSGDDAVCSVGPAVSVQWGLNLWGKGYNPNNHERGSAGVDVDGNAATSLNNNYESSGFHLIPNMASNVNSWEEVALIVVVSLFMVSLGYAILYPFSSRADFGFIGRAGLQKGQGTELWRNEAGIYFRGYLSQHFPLYIYGSGLFSHQIITIQNRSETHDVFIKRLGLGLMSPTHAGPYFQGTWERSTLLDPTAKDVIQDSSTNKARKKNIAEILDGSNFELGWLWYL